MSFRSFVPASIAAVAALASLPARETSPAEVPVA
jgi:hypothetical protein